MNIIGIVSTFDEVYANFADLIDEAEDRLETCAEKQERQKLKSIIRRISHLDPFNAKGYSSITKESITGMLSVRYLKRLHILKDFIKEMFFSITYIIILVQFQVSSPSSPNQEADGNETQTI